MNILVFLYMEFFVDGQSVDIANAFALRWALVPEEFLNGSWWQPVSCMFLHGGMLHLAVNMLGLWSLGTPIENTLGSARFLWLYFISGATGSMFVIAYYLIFGPESMPFGGMTVGASGAVLGILGALGIFYPNSMLLVFFIPMKAITAVVVFAALSIFFQITGMVKFISHLGHLGGLLAGVLYSKFALGLSMGQQTLSPGQTFASRFNRPRPGTRTSDEEQIADLLNRLSHNLDQNLRGPVNLHDARSEKIINPRPDDLGDRVAPGSDQSGDLSEDSAGDTYTGGDARNQDQPKKLVYDPITGKFFLK